MKKLIAIMSALLLLPLAMATDTSDSGTIGGAIEVEDFPLKVWQCGHRVVSDDAFNPWRVSGEDDTIYERNNNYLFEGESYSIDVLVMDKNKIDEVAVDAVLRGESDDLSLNCVPITADQREKTLEKCNAKIDEEDIQSYDPLTMAFYRCSIEIPDSEIAYGEYELTVEVTDHEGEQDPAQIDETSNWFLNPIVSLGIEGDLDFSGVRPGTSKYSRVNLKNLAEGGVLLDMFIVGEDWDSVGSVQGRCNQGDGTLINQLPLSAFRYYVENGAYSSRNDAEVETGTYEPASYDRNKDTEGYVSICKKLDDGFEESMFNECEILQASPVYGPFVGGQAWLANLLYPGSSGMAMTFKLDLPEPCYGSYENADGFTIFGQAV